MNCIDACTRLPPYVQRTLFICALIENYSACISSMEKLNLQCFILKRGGSYISFDFSNCGVESASLTLLEQHEVGLAYVRNL